MSLYISTYISINTDIQTTAYTSRTLELAAIASLVALHHFPQSLQRLCWWGTVCGQQCAQGFDSQPGIGFRREGNKNLIRSKNGIAELALRGVL